MQYILTEDEYNKLQADNTNTKLHNMKKKDLESFCKQVANTMPVTGCHVDEDDDNAVIINGEKAVPWNCIYSDKVDDWYCDECPCTKICPMNKEWSK